jgi:hypothetical protein
LHVVHVWRDGKEAPGIPVQRYAKKSGDIVDLRSHSPDYPGPSPFLLKIHASLSQVLHASGAGEVIDNVMREWEEYKVLADDGSDAHLLSARLSLIPAF